MARELVFHSAVRGKMAPFTCGFTKSPNTLLCSRLSVVRSQMAVNFCILGALHFDIAIQYLSVSRQGFEYLLQLEKNATGHAINYCVAAQQYCEGKQTKKTKKKTKVSSEKNTPTFKGSVEAIHSVCNHSQDLHHPVKENRTVLGCQIWGWGNNYLSQKLSGSVFFF